MHQYGDWAAQQLAEFLAALSEVTSEEAALRITAERTGEALEAEVALLVRDERILAAIGYPDGATVDSALLELPIKTEAAVEVWMLGRARAAAVEVDDVTRLVLARAGDGAFDRNELTLLRGMTRVLALTLRMLRTLEAERRLRELSESHAGELRERHDLSERRFRVLFDEAGIGISLLNLETGVTETNQALQRMLGRTADELRLPDEFDRLTHPEDREGDRRLFERFVAGELPDLRLEKRFLVDDGRIVWADVTFTHLRGPHTDPHFALALHEDITERKLAEEERARLEAELRQAQKMEAIGRLAGGVAHDFNNLLTAISGFNEIALFQADGNEELRTSLLEIQLAAKRAAELTRQLLAFGRKQVLRPRVLDLNAVVREMEGMLRRLIGEHIELRVALAPGVHAIHADRGQLEQVLANLAINARDAMGEGGILTIETWQIDLDDRAARGVELDAGRYAGLVVGDTGHGMDAETLARAFEPFFTTKEPGKGTGLGLATVYGIVKQSGGSISVASSPGRGARFTILLPQIDSEPEADAASSVTGALPRGTETVLVVEDEALVRRFVRETLERQGYKVLTARDAADALAQLGGDASIDVLLTDVVMPKMSGRELAQRLVASRPLVKVLYMSGYTEDAVVHAGAAAGAFLAKPFGRGELVRTVRDLLDA